MIFALYLIIMTVFLLISALYIPYIRNNVAKYPVFKRYA